MARFSLDGYSNATASAAIAELAEVYALPGTEEKLPITHGDRQIRPHQSRLDMSGHVVGSFDGVDIVGIAFGNELVENRPKVMADVRVGVLVQGEAGAGVQDNEMRKPDSDILYLRNLALNLTGNEVEPPRSWLQTDDLLHKHFSDFNRHLTSARYLYGMARIALTCTGEGLGHASRIVSIASLLRERHAVTICCPPHVFPFMRENLGPDLVLIPIPYLAFVKIRSRVDVTRTFLRNIPMLFRLPRILRVVGRELRRRQIDALVSDYDPFGALAARQAGIPVLQINHPSIVRRHCDLSPGALLAVLVSRMVMACYDRILTVSFFDGDIGPVVRPSIDPARSRAGDTLVVYLKSDYRRPMLRILNELSIPNVVIYPHPERNIIEDLHTCRAVISSAGHQFMSEALVLGKPVFAIPQKHQYEQLLNARMLQASGRGSWAPLSEVRTALPQFLASIDAFPQPVTAPDVRFRFGNELPRAVEAIEAFAAEARTRQPQPLASRPLRGSAWSVSQSA